MPPSFDIRERLKLGRLEVIMVAREGGGAGGW